MGGGGGHAKHGRESIRRIESKLKVRLGRYTSLSRPVWTRLSGYDMVERDTFDMFVIVIGEEETVRPSGGKL